MPTPLDHLWNGWRANYVRGLEGDGPQNTVDVGTRDAESSAGDGTPAKSVFTRILESGLPDSDTNIVHRGERCFVILNAFPYTVGHMLVLPYRQVSSLNDLKPAEAAELWAAVTNATTAAEVAYRPAGLNVGINLGAAAGGSVSEHLHVHVLPRWVGDSNFATTIANARTIPEPLEETAAKLREAWPIAH